MATYPCCQRGAPRVIAAITQAVVITRMLRHVQLTAIPSSGRTRAPLLALSGYKAIEPAASLVQAHDLAGRIDLHDCGENRARAIDGGEGEGQGPGGDVAR